MSRCSPMRCGWNTRTFWLARFGRTRPPPTIVGKCWQPLQLLDGGSKSIMDGGPICAIQATTSWLSWRSRALRGLLSLTTCVTSVAAS